MPIETRGLDKVLKVIQFVGAPLSTFDKTVREVAIDSSSRLKRTTPIDSGNTARAWTTPRRIKESEYANSNDAVSYDKKHLIANILNYGRGPIYPVTAKRLYIPFSNKAKAKRKGAKIPSGLKWGVDFVLAKKARAYKGTKFIDKEVSRASFSLQFGILRDLRRLISGL